MKIIDVINFYYANYQVIDLKVEKNNGIRGKSHKFTKNEALKFLLDWKNEEAINVMFQTHYTMPNIPPKPCIYPILYIMFE